MAVLTAAVATAMAGVLLWAGLEKLRDLASMASTLSQLGVPAGAARPAAGLLAATEVAVAMGLLFRPDSVVVLAAVVVLAMAFAAAGVLALGRAEPIRCSCFGSAAGGSLGLGQVAALVPWLAAVAVLRLLVEAPPSPAAGAGRLAAVGLALASWRTLALWEAWRQARGDRRSAREMYVWLR